MMPGITSYQFLDSEGNVLSSSNGGTLLMPASNMKIVSGFSAYKILGKDYVFHTDFSLNGEEIIVSGDPTFLLSGPKLLEIGRSIRDRGQTVSGIVLDTSCIDQVPYGKGWMMEDRKYTYQAKIAPFSVNEGSFFRDWKTLEDLNDPHSEKMKPVMTQTRFFAECLWTALGLKGDPKYRIGKESQGEVVASYTVPIQNVLAHIETVSCNFSIEVLTKFLSHKLDGNRGTWNRSMKAIYKVLNGLDIDTSEIRIMDGSGLSRLNLLTADFLSNLIFRISKSEYREFLKLLPEIGNGTLKGRLGEIGDKKINAKTGSIEYCSTLSGFSEKNGVSFSIMINHSPQPEGILRSEVDRILVKEIKKPAP